MIVVQQFEIMHNFNNSELGNKVKQNSYTQIRQFQIVSLDHPEAPIPEHVQLLFDFHLKSKQASLTKVSKSKI